MVGSVAEGDVTQLDTCGPQSAPTPAARVRRGATAAASAAVVSTASK
jgi:hypothetical protein